MPIIAHLDMDAFFAAIEERDNPRFRGLPIVIGADPKNGEGRGVVSTANYKAREYGIRSALPIGRAWRFSEEARQAGKAPAIFLPVSGRHYDDVSKNIMAIIRRCVSLVEEASVDEAYVDLSFTGSFQKAEEIALQIKKDIFAAEKLTASIGIGSNKLIAKIASDRNKPNGLTVVPADRAEEFLAPLSVRVIPGIGPKTGKELADRGIHTVGDLQTCTVEELYDAFGEWGVELHKKARGMDDGLVTEEYETKSIGEQETFEKDTLDVISILECLSEMCANVIADMRRQSFASFRTVVVTARFSDFTTKTRSHTLKAPQASAELLQFEALKLLMPFLDRRENPRRMPMRLVGVRIEKLNE